MPKIRTREDALLNLIAALERRHLAACLEAGTQGIVRLLPPEDDAEVEEAKRIVDLKGGGLWPRYMRGEE